MAFSGSPHPSQVSSVLKPTEYLIQAKTEQLNELEIFLLAKEGFALKDVQAMLALSDLYSSAKVAVRIVGMSTRTFRRQALGESGRLSAHQSAVAFQYAKALEHATSVFGTLKSAEGWLDRPCRYLSGNVPIDLIDNPLGFRAVEAYLERIELGVYQ